MRELSAFQRAAGRCEAARNPQEITLEQAAERGFAPPVGLPGRSAVTGKAHCMMRKEMPHRSGKVEWYREAQSFRL